MLQRNRGKEIVAFDPEIERTVRQKQRKTKAQRKLTMDNELAQGRQPMKNFADPNVSTSRTGLKAPTTPAAYFEIKPNTILMVQQNQYGGAPTEDPHAHLRAFERICNTFRIKDVNEDALKLRLFSFSLKGRAEIWIEGLSADQIKTWAELKAAFLQKFFPPGRTAQLMADITHFSQWEHETLYEAWDRYKEMIKKCPHHGLHGWIIIQTFFGGLHPQHKNDITSAAGGALMDKTYDDAIALIENLAEHSYATPRSSIRKVAQVQETEELKTIKAQLAALTNQLSAATIQPQFQGSLGYQDPMGVQQDFQPMEQVQFLQNRNNRPRNDPFSNTYNEGWKKHPNFAWRDPKETMGQQQHQQQHFGNTSNHPNSFQTNNAYKHAGQNQRRMEEPQPSEKKNGMEDMMMKFISKMEGTMDTMKATTEQNSAAIKILERQMGQISDALQQRPMGQFPSNTERKEDCKVIQLRSGKELTKGPYLDEEGTKVEAQTHKSDR